MKYDHRAVLFLLLTAMFASGCHTSKKNPLNAAATSKGVTDSSYFTSCPYLTRDASGNPVLSWVQQNDKDGMAQVYYATYADSNKSFGKPHPVPTSAGVEPHGENLPKIIFQKNGNVMVVFSIKNPHPGNPYTGAVYYTQSFDKGQNWEPAQPLIKDTAKSYDQRYFDVALLPDGNVGMVWLNNSKPAGSTLYFARTDHQKGFSAGKIIGKHTCQCCRTDLLVDDSGDIHVAWRDILHDSIRDMVYCYSDDTGQTFSDPVRISPDNWVVNGCPHTGPSMAMNNEGLHFTWFTMGGGGGVYYCHTNNNGLTFSQREAVSELSSARHPQMAVLPDNDLAIVWDEGVQYGKFIHQRIGLQQRGPAGLLLDTRYLTPDSINATFAQIKVLDGQSVLVAYTQENGNKQEVRYQFVSLSY